MKTFIRLSVFALLLTCPAAFAEEQAAAPAAGDAAQAERMQKVKERTTPGASHRELEQLAGNWTYTAKFWMDPTSEPQESKGTTTSEMVFGGRFLKDTTKGDWMGEPFEGLGYTGYDNVRGEYVSVWLDSAATGIMHSTGSYDAAAKKFTYNGTGSCPMTGEKDMKMRMEIVVADKDHYTMSGYSNGPDGKEFKGMEMAFART